ncbi:MAG: hypothetical protein V4772_24380 [Pseudomonadota bacterium]
MSAVLASLLHFPIESVPTFSDGASWIADLNKWLRPYGLAYLLITKETFDEAFSAQGIEDCYHEMAGPSVNFAGVDHACGAHDGKFVYDPHPEGKGLEQYTTCGVFIALRPWRAME